jgi:uncharacterized protein with beta-barrel porin domain
MAKRGPIAAQCKACRHERRAEIEGLVCGGASMSAVGKRFGLTISCLSRHFAKHVTPERRAALMLGPAKMESLANQAAEESRTLLERMNIATSLLFSRFVACAEAGDDFALANIAGRLNTLFRDYASLTGELRGASTVTINNQVNIISSPEFIELQAGLRDIYREHPEVRASIVALLRKLDARNQARSAPPMINGEVTVAA